MCSGAAKRSFQRCSVRKAAVCVPELQRVSEVAACVPTLPRRVPSAATAPKRRRGSPSRAPNDAKNHHKPTGCCNTFRHVASLTVHQVWSNGIYKWLLGRWPLLPSASVRQQPCCCPSGCRPPVASQYSTARLAAPPLMQELKATVWLRYARQPRAPGPDAQRHYTRLLSVCENFFLLSFHQCKWLVKIL